MSYRNNKKSSPTSNAPILPGIIIGVTVGLVIAGGMAWYILKTPSNFINPEKFGAAKLTPPIATTAPASAVGASKPRFEFYKVLTDNNTNAAPQSPPKNLAKSTVNPTASTVKNELYYLQVGSFSNADDADKLKAKLALMGMEAAVQVATIPDKGVWHRVRLGPYSGQSEAHQARETLKLNGVEATPMRAQ